MGSVSSSIAADFTGLGDLPESCVAEIVLRLSPPEICRLARVSRAFRGAASADFVWESKLPPNFSYLLRLALGVDKEENNMEGWGGSKKEIFARLCRPCRFDGGKKEFVLEKVSGGVCVEVSSRALGITGIDDRRYWNYVPSEESRFHTIAYLTQIWWLEVAGEIDFCFPEGIYSLFFRLHLGRVTKRLGRRVCGTEHVHGWDIKPVRFQLSTSDGQHVQSKCYLEDPGSWIHYHVGDFVVKNSHLATKVKFSMTQIDCTHTKGGLCIDSVLLLPKNSRLGLVSRSVS